MSNSLDLDEFLNNLTASGVLDDKQLEKVNGWNFENPVELSKELVARQWLTKWQARQISNGKTRLFVGKYRIERPLQKNRSFSILSARHDQMDRNAVLYVTSQRDNVNDFLKKARQLAGLNHPNLQHVYDFDHDRKKCFLVMESVQGELLVERLRSSECDPSTVLRWLSLLTEALDHMHQANIAHGAISLSRVVYDSSKNAKLVGIAESISSDRAIMLDPETLQHDITCWHEVLDELIGGAASVDGQREFGNKARAAVNQRLESAPAISFLKEVAQDFSKWATELRNQQTEANPAPSLQKTSRDNEQTPSDVPTRTTRKALLGGAVAICFLSVLFLMRNSLFPSKGEEVSSSSTAPNQSSAKDDALKPSQPITDNNGAMESSILPDFGQAGPINTSDASSDNPSDTTSDPLSRASQREEKSFADATMNDSAVASTELEANDTNKLMKPIEDSKPLSETKTKDEPGVSEPIENQTQEIQNPFTEKEFAVTLPIAKKSGNLSPLELGIANADGIKLFADLLGGDTAHRNAANFEVKEDSGSNRWQVVMRDPRSDSVEKVATIESIDNNLVFSWIPELNKFSLANHLRNCILRFRYAKFEYRVILRNDILHTAPISVGCWKPAHAKRVAIRYSPAMEALRYEVIEIDPQELEIELLPELNCPLESPIKISVGTKAPHPLLFQLSKLPRRPISMVVTPMLRIPQSDNFQAMSMERFLQIKQHMTVQKDTKTARKKQFDTMLRRMSERGISNEQKENLKISYKTRERIIKDSEEEMTELNSICHQMATTRIRYRVFLPVGEYEIELIRSEPFDLKDANGD